MRSTAPRSRWRIRWFSSSTQDDTNDNVAVPQNLAGALNYDCVNCITYALARQLFVTLDEELSPTAKEQLDALWIEIAAYGEQIAEGDPTWT